ncbi:MAG: alpha/beta fold hydrolase [Pseudomonadales bacterium]|nr:alpha/beta fold hydrolase [Pseudomonadales bacterium]MBO6565018.1 alpha/beta fold hydrolase [Pseudomonadales bacterium]MBO6597247.1 alpha/beta fold hydrolase [Pseudomonadales bacterium]MBO6655247.1 alpha/beta fold hydrolase [Pseudomonadales bacterium]MBO6703876.1 alpha/beta fold hydrolase [Pseudomonadales bacterium]
MTRTIADLGPDIHRMYPYASNFANVNGWRMHYVDEGPVDAPPVLLLHGNPTWGFLWRETMVPLLEAGYRVIVPDQIGFGLSEHPHAASAHSLDNHAANLVALIDLLELKNLFFVCHDWGGPTGLSALLTRKELAAGVAVMNTWAWREPSSDFHAQVMPWLTMHAPIVGPYTMGRQGGFPGRVMYLSVVDREKFKNGAMKAYQRVLADPDDRRLTWQWPRSIPINPETDIAGDRFAWLEEGVRALEIPSCVIWGREEVVFTADVFASHWHEIWPHAEGTHMVSGNHFLQEDSGREIGDLLTDFAKRNLRGTGR